MAIDAHYHLDKRIQTIEALLAEMEQHGVDRVALIAPMVEPFEITGVAAVASRLLPGLLLGWRAVGLRLYRNTVTADGQFSALGKLYCIYDVPDNGSVSQAMQAHPERFVGWVFVNPRAADPLAELERWAGQPGWIGVKAHPFWHRYAVSALDDVGRWCQERGWPLLIHLGGDGESGDFRFLPERHPHLKVVYAHAGIPFYRQVWEYARGKEHVWVDLSNPVYVNDRVRMETIKTLGAAKCVGGTDGPYGHAGPGWMVRTIRQLPLSGDEQERILGGNFTQLTGAD